METLEDRTVPALTYGSAFAISPAMTSDLPRDANGNVYITGDFGFVTDFDPANSYTDNHDILSHQTDSAQAFVDKYAPGGSFVWAKRIGTGVSTVAIAVDAAGNIAVTGNIFVDTSSIMLASGTE